jgi:hypothetical protein
VNDWRVKNTAYSRNYKLAPDKLYDDTSPEMLLSLSSNNPSPSSSMFWTSIPSDTSGKGPPYIGFDVVLGIQ